MSGREDSNLRPPEPHSGALAKLRHAPVGKSSPFTASASQTPLILYRFPPFGKVFPRFYAVSSGRIARPRAGRSGAADPVVQRLYGAYRLRAPTNTAGTTAYPTPTPRMNI